MNLCLRLQPERRFRCRVKKETAQMLTTVVFEVSEKLNTAVAEIQRAEPIEVFQRERTAIGRVMGAIHFEILERVFSEHPDIVPDWWKRN